MGYHTERALKLKDQSREYHLQDPRWQKNFRARVNRLVKHHNPSTTDNHLLIMIVDHIAMKTGMAPRWKKT